MALKATKNGEYKITSMKQAKEALALFQAQKSEIEEIRAESGLADLEKDSAELKKAATAWAVENEVERIDFDQGFHATLVRQNFDAQFIATSDDVPENYAGERKIVPLQEIIEKKFKGSIKEKGKARRAWNRVTRRIVDRALVDQAVSEGFLTVDELAPCFVEREKAPYLRIFEE